MVTGDSKSHRPIPKFLKGRIHSQADLRGQELVHDPSMETTLQILEPVTAEPPQDSINRLADLLVNLQIKLQSITIRPVTTTTFDGKSEKFELFEDLFHTMIKMEPVMTEQMKIIHLHSLLRRDALQTVRNTNFINRQTLEDALVIFRQTYIELESQVNAKHKWHRVIFDPTP